MVRSPSTKRGRGTSAPGIPTKDSVRPAARLELGILNQAEHGRMAESMTFGGIQMATDLKLVRVQAKGQVTLPADIRKRLGLKKGDYVAVEETPEGVLITSRAMAAIRALDNIGRALTEKGLSLEDMIESGREIREELYREQYGHLDTKNP
jgi:AbrB family looped-hinge helix DNA binding protein